MMEQLTRTERESAGTIDWRLLAGVLRLFRECNFKRLTEPGVRIVRFLA
jgi:hypothetical protein